jgi:hypothetical protein
MVTTADYGQPSEALAAPSLSAWAAAVHAAVGPLTPVVADKATGRLAIGGVEMGDTGWREVSDTVRNGFVPNARIGLRRCGNIVFWVAFNLDASGATGNEIISLPFGFRADPTAVYAQNHDTSLAPSAYIFSASVSTTARVSGLRYHASWPTADAWPTTLPGTAA